MENISVAILGAGKGKIGYWQVREFAMVGGKVKAILGSTPESSANASQQLRDAFGINAKHYSDLETLLSEINPQIVSVCTPNKHHYQHAKSALEHGSHVLCEKPLCWDPKKSPEQNLRDAEELFHTAIISDRILLVNTQLVAVFDEYIKFYDNITPKPERNAGPLSFEVKIITGGSASGESQTLPYLVDLLPHALSLLLRIDPNGKIVDDKVEVAVVNGHMRLNFTYFINSRGPINISFELGYNPTIA